VKIQLGNDSYSAVNLTLAGIILAIIVYSFVFGGIRDYPIPSGSALLTGADSISTGLSRSFSAIVRLNLDEARAFNPHGIRIFMFFLVQLLMRATALIISDHINRRMVVICDIILSVSLFILCFWPFLENFYRTFLQ
jgi:hypothetical protein